jgi:hypothetical protein
VPIHVVQSEDIVSYAHCAVFEELWIAKGGNALTGATSWFPTAGYTSFKVSIWENVVFKSVWTSASLTSHTSWATTSPVKIVKAASGMRDSIAANILSSSERGGSQVYSPYGPAGKSLFPGASASVYGLQQIGFVQL